MNQWFPWGYGARAPHGGPGGSGFGRRFGIGPERIFGRGDMKFLLLELLVERPKHGYEMIKELEARYAGFYAPSPGSVYPTLQMLEDREYVRSAVEDGKRIYSITDEGRAFLAAHAESEGGIRRKSREFGASPEMRAFAREVFDFGRAVVQGARSANHDPAKLARLRGIIDRARREIYTVLAEPPTPPPTEV